MRMSSGASTAYEKPRSGRSSCIDETPRSSRIASAWTPFSASCGSTTPKSPRSRRALHAGALLEALEVRAHRRVAVDRDQLAAALEVGGEQRGVAAGAEGRVDDGLPRAHGERLAHLRGENGDVISRAWLQDVRQHAPHSLRPRRARAARRRDPRSRGGRGRPRRRRRGRASRAPAARRGIPTRPCLSSSASVAPAKKKRCIRRPSLLSGSSVASRPCTSESQSSRRVREETAVHAARHDDPLREGLPEAGRQRETVLVIEGVFVLAEKHSGSSSISTTFSHNKPHRPTWQP